jgi:large subunit ribosomal protein L35
MPKAKAHKGLLKRVRITKTGKVHHRRAGSKHLRSHKSPTRLRRLRKDRYANKAEAKRIGKLLFRSLRGRNQPRTAVKRSPSPEERRAKREAARAEASKD